MLSVKLKHGASSMSQKTGKSRLSRLRTTILAVESYLMGFGVERGFLNLPQTRQPRKRNERYGL
jgi:hypothetical protein